MKTKDMDNNAESDINRRLVAEEEAREQRKLKRKKGTMGKNKFGIQ